MSTQILIGDCREVLRTLPDASVHCCITSPPYWGLRSYLPAGHADKPKEIGSEPTVGEWVRVMVEVFREVRRVLRDDGTLWLNLGDSYAANRGYQVPSTKGGPKHSDSQAAGGRHGVVPDGLKPKDLIGQPWRVAFALQEDGWWLRQELIWAKKNPMPESIRDRFTKAHEHVFLLSKSERYFFDFDAVQEPVEGGAHARRAGYKTPDGRDTRTGEGGHGAFQAEGREKGEVKPPHDSAASRKARANGAAKSTPTELHNGMRGEGVGRRQGPPGNPAERATTPKAALATSGNDGAYSDGKSERMGRGAGWRNKNNASFDEAMSVMPDTRNPRSVRWLASEPFRGAHFATYPPALIEPFVLAGCPEGGTILDPFGGSGTTGLVADRNHRHAILIDLDARNGPMATDRITGDGPLFADVTTGSVESAA